MLTFAWERNPLNPKNFAEDPTACDWAWLDDELSAWVAAAKIPLHNFAIDAADYQAFKSRVAVPSAYAVGYKDKKVLAHYIAFKLLGLDPSDTYLDVASEASPFPRIFREKFGVNAYSQDLTYAPGVHGTTIGSSAEAIPLGDDSVLPVLRASSCRG